MIVESSTAKKTTSKSCVLPADPGDDREGGEDHGHGAAQARRAESTTRSLHVKRAGRVDDGDRDRARDEDEHEREHGPAHGDVVEPAGEDEQPERDEHRHLAHPRQALVEGGHRLLGGDARRAEREPGQVDGQEARSVQGVGAAEGQRGDGERRHRVQARGGQGHAPQRPRGGHPHHEADGQADADLADEEHRHVRRCP